MRQVGVLEAKTHLSKLLEALEKDGETILITRHGKPVARLTRAGGAGRKLPAAEMLERMRRLRAMQSDDEDISWEELKEQIRQ